MCKIKIQKNIFFNKIHVFFMLAGLSAEPCGGLLQYKDYVFLLLMFI